MDNQEQAFEEHIEFFAFYLKNHGMAEGEIEVCLNSIRLSTCFDFIPATIEELRESQAFVAFSDGIGKRKDGMKETIEPRKIQYNPRVYTSGKTNMGLAKIIIDYYNLGIRLPVFSQWEISVALEEMGFSGELHVAKPVEGEYLSTGGVVKQFLEKGLEKMEDIAVVAYKTHMRRARATARYETEIRRGYDFKRVLMVDTKAIPSDPESLQYWTSEDALEIGSEISSRMYYYITPLGSRVPIKYLY